MAESKSYHEQVQVEQTIRLREVLKTLPPFAKDFFRAIEPKSSAKTRINYAYDIRVFFHFLMENNPTYKNYSIDQFTLGDLERLEPVDIEEYMEYLKVYIRDDELVTNGEKGLSRKMSALRSFYNYYFKRRLSPGTRLCWWICQNFMIRRLSVWMRMRSPCFWIL